MDYSLIPQEKSEAVARGLREAFGVAEVEDIRAMTKGHTSAVVLRIVVRGTAYLLRIIVRPNTLVDPARQFICMKAAAEAGLAPRVRYASVDDGILIADFVQEVLFPRTEAVVRMAGVLRKLHSLAPFPGTPNGFDTTCMFLVNRGPALEGLLGKFRASKVLPQSDIEQLLAWHEQVAEVYSRVDPDMVSSHNDLFKPDNVLFDGERVWLVDWEAAFLNDRYADLAAVANLIVRDEEDERLFLREYLGQEPSAYPLARLFLMRQLAHMFYTLAFLFLGAGGKAVDLSKKAPGYGEFHRRMWAGEMDLSGETKVVYGRVHWERLVQNMRDARFGEAMQIVARD